MVIKTRSGPKTLFEAIMACSKRHRNCEGCAWARRCEHFYDLSLGSGKPESQLIEEWPIYLKEGEI